MSSIQDMTSGTGARLFVRYLQQRGTDENLIRDVTGLHLEQLSSPESRVPLSAVSKLVEFAYRVTGDEALALKLVPRDQTTPQAMIGYIVINSESLLSGFEHWSRYIGLDSKNLQISLDSSDGMTTLSGNSISLPTTRWLNELFLSLAVFYGRVMAPQPIRPQRIEMSHERPRYVDEYTRLVGSKASIEFGALSSRLTYRTLDLQQANSKADLYLRGILTAYADSLLLQGQPDTVSGIVEQEIRRAISTGRVRVADIATVLYMAPSTLGKRLAEEGTTYTELLEKVRKELALVFLRGERTVKQVSEMLGYSEHTSFQHSFRRWYGQSPLKYMASRDTPGN